MFKKLSIVLLLVMFFSLSIPVYALAQSSMQTEKPPPQSEEPSVEEFEARGAQAEDLQIEECDLPTPQVEGVLHDMGAYEDTTRSAVCIDTKGFTGIAFSTWSGAPDIIRSFQRFKVKMRLLDANSLELISETVWSEDNNPRIQGPPSTKFNFQHPCGQERQYLLLLDVSARQLVGGVEVGGVENRDYSWKFTLPKRTCSYYLPLVIRQVPECPSNPCVDYEVRYEYPVGTFLRNLAMALMPDTFTGDEQQLVLPNKIRGIVYKDGTPIYSEWPFELKGIEVYLSSSTGKKKDISDRAKTDGQFDVGCYDIELSTSIWDINVIATIEIPGCGKFKCQNNQPVWDPPALVADKVVSEHPELKWDEVYKLASEMIENKEMVIDSDSAVFVDQLAYQIISILSRNLRIDH